MCSSDLDAVAIDQGLSVDEAPVLHSSASFVETNQICVVPEGALDGETILSATAIQYLTQSRLNLPSGTNPTLTAKPYLALPYQTLPNQTLTQLPCLT